MVVICSQSEGEKSFFDKKKLVKILNEQWLNEIDDVIMKMI